MRAGPASTVRGPQTMRRRSGETIGGRLHQIPAFKIGTDWRLDRDTINKWIADRTFKGKWSEKVNGPAGVAAPARIVVIKNARGSAPNLSATYYTAPLAIRNWHCKNCRFLCSRLGLGFAIDESKWFSGGFWAPLHWHL